MLNSVRKKNENDVTIRHFRSWQNLSNRAPACMRCVFHQSHRVGVRARKLEKYRRKQGQHPYEDMENLYKCVARGAGIAPCPREVEDPPKMIPMASPGAGRGGGTRHRGVPRAPVLHPRPGARRAIKYILELARACAREFY